MARADATASRTSRVGKRPVTLPKGVTATLSQGKVQVKGPKGTLSRELPREVAVAQEGDLLNVSCTAPGRDGARLQGLARALLANMVKGVATGYERRLELHGTGYRAEVKGKILHCLLGYSHPIEHPIPEGITIDIPKESKGQLIILNGADKEVIGQLAATVRGFRKPEPYGGKGVRYQGERIREKAGKAGK
jgi:large subunit ribosomal protein L6